MVSFCGAVGCSNRQSKTMSVFRCPKDPARCKKWVINSRRQDLLPVNTDYCSKNIRFCQVHFENHFFMNSDKNSLVFNAEPRLFDISNSPKIPSTRREIIKAPLESEIKEARRVLKKVEETQEHIEKKKKYPLRRGIKKQVIIKEMLELKRRLRVKNDALRHLKKQREKERKQGKQNISVQTIIKSVQPSLKPSDLLVLTNQLKNGIRNKNKYSTDFKMLCISICYKSPSCYKFLTKRLSFPARSTIVKWTGKIEIYEGFDPKLLKLLSERVARLPENDRVCSLMIDEIALKSHVDYDRKRKKFIGVGPSKEKVGELEYHSEAIVFMLSGLKKKWRQAIGYFFCFNTMAGPEVFEKLKLCLDQVWQTGMKIKVISCDQGSNFSSLYSLLGISVNCPYFLFNSEKIFVTPDPPHLLKSARNCLLKNRIVTSKGTASWNDIKNLFELEKKKNVRLAPKISEKHVEPPPIWGKMKVKLATQVLSHSVSAAIRTYEACNDLSCDSLGTAAFCTMMNDIFDVLNSNTLLSPCPLKKALSPMTSSESYEFIDGAINWLKTWKIYDKNCEIINHRFRFLDGLCLALVAAKNLSFELMEKYDFQYLMTRRLCTDNLEGFFSIIRSKGGSNSNPTCYSFQSAFKQAVIN